MNDNNLLHAVLNEIERDLNGQDYDAIDELLQKLINIPDAKELLIGYLSDDMLEAFELDKVEKRYKEE